MGPRPCVEVQLSAFQLSAFELSGLQLSGLQQSGLLYKTMPLQESGQRSTSRGSGVDFGHCVGIFDQRRCVVRFDTCVDHQGASASPVFVFGEAVDSVDIRGGIAAREGCP